MKITANIDRMLDSEKSNVKAIATVTIDDEFAIHGVKVVNSSKGMFVQMPQNSFEKNGKKQYSDIIHPLSSDTRKELNDVVISAYNHKLSPQTSDIDPYPFDERVYGPSM